MGFPALRLPQVAFDNVYKFLDVPEIILLSQCSKRMKATVRSQEGPRQDRQVAVDFYQDYVEVAIVKRIDPFVTHHLLSLRINQSGTVLSDEVIKVDGISWKISKIASGVDRGCLSVSETGCFEKDLLSLIAMLRHLFNCSIAQINVYHDQLLRGDRFQKLFVETDALRRADRMKKIESNFPSIHFNPNTRVNLEKLLEMSKTSRNLTLCKANLISDKDINQFLKNWLSSDNKTLRSVRLSRFPSSQNKVAIMEGIAFTPGRKKREKDSECGYTEWHNGLDIIRKDGVHATILVINTAHVGQFLFFVWQTPDPNE